MAPVTGSGAWPAWTARVSSLWLSCVLEVDMGRLSLGPPGGEVLDEVDLGDHADQRVGAAGLLPRRPRGPVEHADQLGVVEDGLEQPDLGLRRDRGVVG